jgi:protein-disulfide isomerase
MTKKKRRKMTKAQAKVEAQRRKRQQQLMWAVAAAVAAAVIIVFFLIVIGGNQGAVADANVELVEVDPLRTDVENGITEEGYPYRGDADAPVTIVEYSDYNCPHCEDFNTTTASQVDDELVSNGTVKYVVPPYALWEESEPIVEAAVCAREQGRFWEFHQLLFANQGAFSQQSPSRALLRRFADASGLDVDQFEACLDEGRRDEVRASTKKAKEELGVNSTPTFFVNGQRLQLSADEAYIDTIRNAVQAALEVK